MRSSSVIEINLDALAQNYALLKSQTPAKVAGVLKANAYGIGVRQVFDILCTHSCDTFFVATLDEGIALRSLNDKVRIYILGGYFQGAEDIYKSHKLTPVIGSLEAVQRAKGHKQDCALHFDTGMNRLGFDSGETNQILNNKSGVIADLKIDYILSHFACADEKDHALNARQLSAFEKIATHFPDTPKSLCNSSGSFRYPDHHYDLIRPGYALYGGNPTPETQNPMHDVVSARSRILQTRMAEIGETTGYAASHTFHKRTPLATISLGYADGFLRAGSNQTTLYYKGQPCPVLGRISMDLVTISLEHCSQNTPKAGDWVEIIGPHQNIDTLAQSCNTIGYEILTSLSHRSERIYTHK